MEALRIISEDHANLWRLATSLTRLIDEIEGGARVDPEFFRSVFEYIESAGSPEQDRERVPAAARGDPCARATPAPATSRER